MDPANQPEAPSWQWRAASSATMGFIGTLCRSFLYTLATTEVHGLDEFLQLLDERQDVRARTKGLITVSNHISVYVRSTHLQTSIVLLHTYSSPCLQPR